MRVLLVCADKGVTEAATQILHDAGIDVESIERPELPNAPDVDAILLWHQDLRKMSRTRRLDLLRLSDRTPLIDVMKIDDVTTMTEGALLADGIVFVDANLRRLVEIVNLTRAGYMLVPKDLTPERLRSSVGHAAALELSELDLEILGALADGLSDREISARLHVSEPTAKRLVHRLMRKLRVENRTRAAVYLRLLVRLRESLEEKH